VGTTVAHILQTVGNISMSSIPAKNVSNCHACKGSKEAGAEMIYSCHSLDSYDDIN